MPFNRRVPFLYQNKSQHSLENLRNQFAAAQSKQRSNSQKPFFNVPEDLHDSDKLFHTIGAISSEEFLQALNQNPYARNANWVQLEESITRLFKNNGQLEHGMLKQTHENLESLLNSIGILCFERLKSQVLPKAVRSLRTNINQDDYVESLASVWRTFFHEILSTLECMLYSIEPFNNVSIRQTTLQIFRDQLLINSPLESKLKELLENGTKIPEDICHMILIIQNVYEQYPPSDNKLQIEKIAALVITPYIGYYGLYLNHSQIPVIRSREPYLKPQHFMRTHSLHHYHQTSAASVAGVGATTNNSTAPSSSGLMKPKFQLYPVNESELMGTSETENVTPTTVTDSTEAAKTSQQTPTSTSVVRRISLQPVKSKIQSKLKG